MHLNTHGPHSSEGSESINTTDVTITAAENVQCQSIDLKINDAYGAKGDQPFIIYRHYLLFRSELLYVNLNCL